MTRPGETIGGRYRLEEHIASGGMSSVWSAWDERLQRRVAVKQLHTQPGLAPSEARLAADRAVREARLTARLHHPNAVTVYDIVDEDGMPSLIMQYLPSRSLQSVLVDRGPMPVPEVARIGAELAGALAAAHAVGIVHRDVKPGNVLIDADGTARLTDFGIAHAMDDATVTSTGILTGTPAYLAPEVARGEPSGPASDIFSLGATLYALLEGRPPFGAVDDNAMAVLHRAASGHLRPMSRSGQMTPLLTQLLAVDPRDRPGVETVADRLTALATDVPPLAEPEPAPLVSTLSFGAPEPDAPVDGAAPGVDGGARPLTGDFGPATTSTARRRNRRRGVLVAAVVAVVLVAGGIAALATTLGGSTSPQAARTRSTAAPPAPSTTRSTPTSPSAPTSPSSRRTPTRSSSAPTTPRSTHRAPATHASRPTVTRAGVVQSLTSYYALLPGDTSAAWPRLTPSYQSGTAVSRSYFDNFWSQYRDVTLSDVQATSPGDVQAEVTYTYQDGSSTTELTSYSLVRQDGELKIASSTVES